MKKLSLIIAVLFSLTLSAQANTEKKEEKVCSGFGKWTEEGEFKIIRSNCITEKEYQARLNAKNYLCNYYQKSIWKESERAYGKKQYKWSEGSLERIKSLKDEVLEATQLYMSRNAPRAAVAMVSGLLDPTELGIRDKMSAAKELLDRTGLVKTEKMQVESTGGVMLLPAKDNE